MSSEKEFEKKIKNLQIKYKTVFGSDEGQEVILDLERRCHYHSTTNVAYMEGQRSVLLFIKQMLQKENKNVK